MWWALALILVAYVGFTAAVLAAVFGGFGGQLADTPGSPALPDNVHLSVYSVASTFGYVFPVLLGALVTASEFRHQTLTPTFLATPHRGTVLAAKAVVMLVTGALFGVAGLVGSIGLGAPILGFAGVDAGLAASDTWLLVGRVVIAMALWAVIGVGLGALIPSQVAAIVVVLAFTQFLEPILRLAPSVWEWTADVVKFLPGAASDALVGSSGFSAFTAESGAEAAVLEWWQGGLVLLAIAVAALIGGQFTSWRRDVT
jgi:hypothetical protein